MVLVFLQQISCTMARRLAVPHERDEPGAAARRERDYGMRPAAASFASCLLLLTNVLAAPPSVVVEKKTVAIETLPKTVRADLFQTDFLVGDSNYHSLLAASDGKLHFTINTHDSDNGCRYYTFDPKTQAMTLVAKLDEVLNEPAATHIPQGKVHTPLLEHHGRIWFATHTAFYDGDVPGRDPGGKAPYSGGHFMSYDLKSGRFADLAKVMPGEGIITMAMDKENEVLYGLTWPSGILVSYHIKQGDLRYWGAVQNRGEWGHRPWEWDRICRTLGVDPEGNVYGSTMDGLIWKYDPRQPRPVNYIEGLDLSRVPFSQSAQETLKGDFQHNWRVIEWNPATRSFWGLHFETSTLFEFVPSANYVRAVAELRPEPYQGMPRNPEISQLGFLIGPRNTVFYLAHGPAVEIRDRPPIQSGLYLLTYRMEDGRLINHGPVLSADARRVFFAESLAIGPDDRLYTVAWVEVTDLDRAAAIRAARKSGPAETATMVYEIMLVRLPKWRSLVK